MFVSKLTVSDELKQNNLSPQEKGRLRWQRLKEIDASGELQFIKTRKELAVACGFQEGEAKGLSWAGNLYQRGYLSEVNVGFENGKKIKEFHLTGKEPDFDHRGVREALKKELSVKPVEPVVLADAVEKAFEPATILIKKGQMTITITGVDVADAVNKLLK